MLEIYKCLDFLGFANYSVSNLGNVINVNRNKPLKQQTYLGYKCVSLSCDNVKQWFKVHRLVALAFIPNPNNLPFVNHKDENKSNNCVDNLEWCDSTYNNAYGTRIDRCKESLKESYDKRCNNNLSKAVKQIDPNTNEVINVFPSIREAARVIANDTNKCTNILSCCQHKPRYNTAYGFKWEYA